MATVRFGLSLVCLCLLFASCIVSNTYGLKAEDQVHSLPGWDKPLLSDMYSGHISAGKDYQNGTEYEMFEHYIFIESEREKSGKEDPLVVWTNGGPGAASLFGLFVELGPYIVSDQSLHTEEYKRTGVPTLFSNPYSWNKVANILILNSPPPVGFSYCLPAGVAGKGESCGAWNDTRTAIHNKIFLENWIEAFPEYASRELYIIGESYAGIYVPTLAREILRDSSSPLKSMLRGLSVGDGCVGTEIICGGQQGPLFKVEFLHGHNQISEKMYREIKYECSEHELRHGVQSKGCQASLDKMGQQVGGYYEYSLYDTCWYHNALLAGVTTTGGVEDHYWGPPRPTDVLSGALNDYPCGGPTVLKEWVGLDSVRDALNVERNSYYFSGDNGAGFTYVLTEKNLLPFYRELALTTDLRVLIYNGDTDPGLNTLVAQDWIEKLGLKEIQPWTPWTIDGKQYMGGYVTRYEGNFDFLTIRGSGHMVPEYKSKESFAFIEKWLAGEDWLPYKTPSQPERVSVLHMES